MTGTSSLRGLFPAPAFFLFLSLTSPGLTSSPAADWQGSWEGTMGSGTHRFRVAFVLNESGGEYNNIDDGIHGEPMTLIPTKGSREYRTSGGADLVLRPDARGQVLAGTFTQGPGSDAQQSLVGQTGYPVTLLRGSTYLRPRVGPDGKEKTDYHYEVPLETQDGWITGDLRTFHADVPRIEDAVRSILQARYPSIHSLLVVKDGRLVLDEYFYGYGPDDPHPLQSVTKPVFSLLFGIGVGQRLYRPDQKLFDFFPAYRKRQGWDPRKNKITLQSLLTMTSGLGCDDFKDSSDCSWAMVRSPDWLDFSLSLPRDSEPKTRFAYCGACLTPLAAILEKQSGMKLPQFAQKYLFDPLGIPAPDWWAGPQGIRAPAGGLCLRPRDMAKIGLLVLQKGKWEGRQVVSEKWIKESTARQVPAVMTRKKDDYGYLWWERNEPWHGRKLRVLDAWGVGGQHIFIAPQINLVCVLTGGNYKNGPLANNSFKIFKDILAAIK